MQSIKIVTFISSIYKNRQITSRYFGVNVGPYICEGLLFGRSYQKDFNIFLIMMLCGVQSQKMKFILP